MVRLFRKRSFPWAGQRRLAASAFLFGKLRGLAGVCIDGRRVIDHQPTSIGRRSISAVQVMIHDPQQSGLLAAVMGCVRQPPGDDPEARVALLEE